MNSDQLLAIHQRLDTVTNNQDYSNYCHTDKLIVFRNISGLYEASTRRKNTEKIISAL